MVARGVLARGVLARGGVARGVAALGVAAVVGVQNLGGVWCGDSPVLDCGLLATEPDECGDIIPGGELIAV